MIFPRVEYIEWIAGRPVRATHDLATTGLHGRHDAPIGPNGIQPTGSVTEQRVEGLLAEEYGVDPECVVVTGGATEAYLLAVATCCDRDDRVLVERPGYEPHWKTPAGLVSGVDRFDRRPSTGYTLEPDQIAAATVDSTAAVVLSNRHNPSGRLTDRGTLERAADAAGDATLIVDEVYAPYVRSPRNGAFGGPTAAGIDGAVVVNSFSKFFGHGDLQIGWLIADPQTAAQARSTAVHFGSPSGVARQHARAILSARDDHVTAARTQFEQHADRLTSFLDEQPALRAPGGVDCSFTVLRHDDMSGKTVASAADEAGVLVVPGRFFGDDERVRIGVAGEQAAMDDALAAFGQVVGDG